MHCVRIHLACQSEATDLGLRAEGNVSVDCGHDEKRFSEIVYFNHKTGRQKTSYTGFFICLFVCLFVCLNDTQINLPLFRTAWLYCTIYFISNKDKTNNVL